VVDFQTAADAAATVWETQCRFVLIDGTTHAIHVDEPHTADEVDEMILEIEELTGTTPSDGEAFLQALATYEDGSRFARMSAPHAMELRAALSTDGMVAVEGDDDAEASIELIGRLVREAVSAL
jgi:hypothetical protein